ncbi:MAG: hypothetical protein HN501_03265, partial [Waddliaceae bacterium]|nr:hypothetical protein [Waddliaceae bacterium]MBT6929187.1 hypothetical protein [Waddliaceae bacterium]MBT7265161.1 hypothetical protein [Waddliaceae bacterium]
MKGLRFSFLIVFFLSFTLFSFADDDAYEENIVVKKGNAEAPDLPSSSVNDYIPDGIFNGTVNVITGDYIENS